MNNFYLSRVEAELLRCDLELTICRIDLSKDVEKMFRDIISRIELLLADTAQGEDVKEER